MIKSETLFEILDFLKSNEKNKKLNYYIPAIWAGHLYSYKDIKVNPFNFYSNIIESILKVNKKIKYTKNDINGNWSKKASTYNIFIRLTTAYDHDHNGKIDINVNDDGWRETGTFLKTIALFPYFKKLGINTLHLLPITSIGTDGHKGNLGSPYAIKNPYTLDENLSEPILDIDVNKQFLSFIEAAKLMGFRIILEFVFRTAAKDSDWIPQYPEWFYWIKEDIEIRNQNDFDERKYGSPIFSKNELNKIHELVNNNKFDNLPEPHIVYKKMFTNIPSEVKNVNGKYIGIIKNKLKAKIPGAFADWPPDDNQPPWSDVTYLRMYKDMKFNYIAYNTIRMYDSRLANKKNINHNLWNKIIGIVPYYQKNYEIDGVMIDMGHALPPDLLKKIQRKARKNNPYFAFWEENFSLTHKSVEQGYNVTLGYLWSDEHHPDKLKNLFIRLNNEGVPLPFFATPETHNTPRAIMRNGGKKYSLFSLYINAFLPAIFFIHSGYELCENLPVNTGLDFSDEEQKKYPAEKLPLFSISSFNWNNKERFIDEIIRINQIRNEYIDIISDNSINSFRLIETNKNSVFGFLRKKGKKKIYVIANTTLKEEKVILYLEENKLINLINDEKINVQKYETILKFKPFEVKVLKPL